MQMKFIEMKLRQNLNHKTKTISNTDENANITFTHSSGDYRTNLHQKALAVAKKYKACEMELIEIIQKLDENKVYYQYGHNSLFQYVKNELELSQEITYIFINVARKAKEIPELKVALQNGHLTMSKARKITSVITKNNKNIWLELAKNNSQQKLEREVAKISPKTLVTEKLQYVHPASEVKEKVILKRVGASQSNNSVRVQLQAGVSEELMLNLRRAQDVLSQKRKTPVSLEVLLEKVTEEFLEKHDPIRKAKRQKMRTQLSAKSKQNLTTHRKNKRTPLPARLKHEIYLKFDGQCSHLDHKNKRCHERRFLEIHHLKAISLGGKNRIENLTLLCHGHHKCAHLKN